MLFTSLILQTKVNATQPLGLLGFPYLISLFGIGSVLLGSAILLGLLPLGVVISKQIGTELDI